MPVREGNPVQRCIHQRGYAARGAVVSLMRQLWRSWVCRVRRARKGAVVAAFGALVD